jgi:hypothetical protein
MFKLKKDKVTLEARNEVQAAAILKQGFEPATKEDAAKLKKAKLLKEE